MRKKEEKIIMQRIEDLKGSGAVEIERMHNHIYYTLNGKKCAILFSF